ncbi:MAG: hypothetical protein LC098_10680 [Burkholderiales bacterium]|uniref:hypothetical protein n=1 Tax=Dokdonella sp. TaxID=2291710 RepID=UPI0027B9BC9E|nr:hypothetical protein [Dokdonella sp.]MCZ2135874.1 hypothetical protein [Burkholderiales bacterium]
MTMTGTPARVNPLDLGDFAPKPVETKAPAVKEVVATVADAHGFPSRQAPKPRADKASTTPKEDRRSRRKTGRDKQVNVKMTPATYEQMDRMSRERDNMPFGELVRIALAALESSSRKAG